MKYPSVSVVLPTHNRASQLPRSIHSILSQSYTDLELIVVDDCSNDDTGDILAKIHDPRLKVVRLEVNAGPGAARNAGIKASSGRLIAFQDSDSEWRPGKLAKQIEELERSILEDESTAACYSRVMVFKNDKERIVPPDQADCLRGSIYRRLLLENTMDTPSMLIRKDVLEQVGVFDEALSKLEDWDLALRLAERHSIAFLDEVTVVSYDSPGSVNKRICPSSALQILQKHLESFRLQPEAMASVAWMIGFAYASLGERAGALEFVGLSCGQSPSIQKRTAILLIRARLNPYPMFARMRKLRWLRKIRNKIMAFASGGPKTR